MKGQLFQHLQDIPWPFLIIKKLAPDKVYTQRMIEGVIIALLTGIISAVASGYVMVQVLDAKLSFLNESVNNNTQDIKELRRDLYIPRKK